VPFGLHEQQNQHAHNEQNEQQDNLALGRAPLVAGSLFFPKGSEKCAEKKEAVGGVKHGEQVLLLHSSHSFS
jgi:hypothetical protein